MGRAATVRKLTASDYGSRGEASGIGSCRTSTGNVRRPRTRQSQLRQH